MARYLCPICGLHFTEDEPRYRRPDGDVHARCFRGPRVLIVDDDPLLRDLVARVVRRDRFCQVDTVANGQEALERLQGLVYDLILCDLRMPEMDGPTFYRRVQAEYPALASRIIFMTVHATREDYATFIRAVGVPLLTKPFAKEDLDAMLGRMMGPSRTTRAK